MKKTIFGLALLAYAGTAQAQGEGTLRIKGQLTGFTDTVLVLRPATRSLNADTTMVTDNGTFDITIKLDKPQSLYLATPGTIRREQNAAFGVQVIGVPGESVELSGDPRTRYDINGSTFYKQYHEADIAMETAQKPINDIYKEYRTRLQAGESQEAVSKDLNPKMEQAQKDYKDAILDFIRQHPDYEASAAIIQQLEELGLMEQAAGLLSESVREGRMKDFYGKAIAAARQAKEAEERAEKLQATGVEAPDFTLNDINGKPLSLSSLRGKHVVLDFWGSWCGWCIKGMPQMKEYYAKYKDKLEILGIDCNDTEEKWKAAVAKHELPWLHVYNPRGSQDDVCSKYGIRGFPTKILVG
ncbi:MAG: TlpA disulfide reductase family protein, partial [Prevotella sp.]|nr:TlpA disulfide reductase family protein [Prevotella sp.]